MSEFYTVAVAVLAVLAVSGLYVGVTNDAVNFLTSAIGSKAAGMRTILAVASAGIILGVVSSSGMMEVARNGMFNPAMFTFSEVMTVYLGVMLANVILLDIYNSLGLPTSTTVSLVFCLLGAAVAVAAHRIAVHPQLSAGDLGDFINTSRAMGIISAILLSVVMAFTCGTAAMWISRMIFSFRYMALFRRFGALWCGVSLTAIIYFAVFKGLKGAAGGGAAAAWIDSNLTLALAVCWAACSAVLAFIQLFRVNILRITILSGTFALALAFAGNDLVNFIGVPVAGFDAFRLARASGNDSMVMSALNENIPADMSFMLAAGAVMVLTLWTSRKAMHVTQTEISLSAQSADDQPQYGSNLFSRGIVRAAVNISNAVGRVTPPKVKEFVARRFEYTDVEHSGAPYDMIRATVNLTASALLISAATSLRLPLSTTYVCFMVAMGSSLADRAWGRESAVYRITGVMTVVMGWFTTALGGFAIALATGLLLVWGGKAAFAALTLLCGYILIRGNMGKKTAGGGGQRPADSECAVEDIVDDVCRMMKLATQIYDRTIVAVFKENRKALRDLVRQSDEIYDQSRKLRGGLVATLRRLNGSGLELSLYYVQIVDYLDEIAKAITHITHPTFEHIDNNHEGLSREQTADLMRINDDVAEIYGNINRMLTTNDFSEIDSVQIMRDDLFGRIADTTKSELARINAGAGDTKASMLYLTILGETKTMMLQARNLLKAQRYFLEHAGTWRRGSRCGAARSATDLRHIASRDHIL